MLQIKRAKVRIFSICFTILQKKGTDSIDSVPFFRKLIVFTYYRSFQK